MSTVLFLSCAWSIIITVIHAGSPRLTSHPLRAEEGSNLTLICTTTEKYIWYINWKRNGDDIFGMGPDTGLASTNKDFDRLKDRVIYSIKPGKQYNMTLIVLDPEVDHGSTWTCRVRGEDSNIFVIRIGDLPLTTSSIPPNTTSATTTTPVTSTNLPTTTTTTTTTSTTTTAPEIISSATNTTQPAESTLSTELPTFDQTNSTEPSASVTSSAQTVTSFTKALKDGTTQNTPVENGMDLAGIAAGGVAGAILLLIVGFCIYGAVRKRRKGR